jgi:citrate synthase
VASSHCPRVCSGCCARVRYPPDAQVKSLSKEWANHADLPTHVVTMLNNFPHNLASDGPVQRRHRCVQHGEQVQAGLCGRREQGQVLGIHVYDDAMHLIAKLPTIASIIYRNLYREGTSISAVDPNKDWSANFAAMLGYENPAFIEMLRMYLVIHSDHEGGNVSAHTCHLVGSALSDPYLSLLGCHGWSRRSSTWTRQPGSACLHPQSAQGLYVFIYILV